MEPFFKKNPRKHPQSLAFCNENDIGLGELSTGLYHGYIATFEIRDKQLFVKDVRIPGEINDAECLFDVRTSVYKYIFPGTNAVKAVWMTGLMITLDERVVRSSITNEAVIKVEEEKGRSFLTGNTEGIYYEIFEEDCIVLEFAQGNFVSERTIPRDKYWDFMNTSEYLRAVVKMKADGFAHRFWGETHSPWGDDDDYEPETPKADTKTKPPNDWPF